MKMLLICNWHKHLTLKKKSHSYMVCKKNALLLIAMNFVFLFRCYQFFFLLFIMQFS